MVWADCGRRGGINRIFRSLANDGIDGIACESLEPVAPRWYIHFSSEVVVVGVEEQGVVTATATGLSTRMAVL